MPTKKLPSFDGFARATSEMYTKHRLFGELDGEPGSRKSSFALEGPAPIFIFGLDKGLEGVVNRVIDEHAERTGEPKEIHVWERSWFPTQDQDLQAEAIQLRDEFAEAWEVAINNGRTVIIDKENDLWALYRYAEFGPPANGEQRDYGALNQRYRRIVNLGKDSDCNVLFIRGMEDVWGTVTKSGGQKGRGPTGKRQPAGFGELSGLVHVVLTFEGTGPNDWQFTVGKVRGPATLTLAGATLAKSPNDPEMPMTLPEFASLVFPDSDDSEWI